MPSYSPVYSAQFIVFTHDSPNNEFAVPEGYTAVIRDVSASQDIGGYTFSVGIVNAAGAPECTVIFLSGFSEFVTQAVQRHIVVPGGGFILVHASSIGSSPSFYVGGYLLRNTLS